MNLVQVAELLESQKVSHPQPQLGPVDGLGQEVLGARIKGRKA